MKKFLHFLPIILLLNNKNVCAQLTGPNSSQSSYLLPSLPGSVIKSILTAGDKVGAYTMAGIPDGLGAFDNGDGTFTVLMNHEISDVFGVVRAHGSKGAFISKWIIRKSDLSVLSGSDLVRKVNIWNKTTSCYTEYSSVKPSVLAIFNRFCSADLPAPSAFYNSETGLGSQARIFMNGEEAGTEGRAFAHIVTGPEAGKSYELPWMGKFSFENVVANPATKNKTVVAGMDDATPGQVYFYIGTKKSSGTEIEKAGLTNGHLYAPVVNGFAVETDETIPAAGTPFIIKDLGSAQNFTGADLQTISAEQGITQFLRPEDGAWDPSNPSDFYFNTTNGFGKPSRLWKLHFSDLTDLTKGGTITVVLNGKEGQQMLDNMAIDDNGHILLQEDAGNNAHIGRVVQYNIYNGKLLKVAEHDSARFITGAPGYLTQDEESSGIIDVQKILGPGMFLATTQAHYSIPGEVVEGGQLMAFFNSACFNKPPVVKITSPINGNHYDAGHGIAFDVQASDIDGFIQRVEFYNGDTKLGEDATFPYSLFGKEVEAGNYTLKAVAIDDSGAIAVSAPVSIIVDSCSGSGHISAEGYTNITGAVVDSLYANAAFPDHPQVKELLDSFEYGKDLGEQYGARVRGYICAPFTGDYTFYISGDDQVGLWLSSSDTAANKKLIAYAEGWTEPRQWDKFVQQKSKPIRLVKGARYYIETLHKEFVGPDHLSVAWKLPNGVLEAPIPGSRLSPWIPGTVFRPNGFNSSMRTALRQNPPAEGLAAVVLPNPAVAYFTLVISADNQAPVNIVIRDMAGRTVEKQTNVTANGSFQFGKNLATGIYILQVQQGPKTQVLKIVKQ